MTDEIVRADQILPSHVLVLSSDAQDWSREWGVREIHFREISGPGMLGLENTNPIRFGPYQRGYPIPTFFCLLDQFAQPVSEWTPLDHRPTNLRAGDTLDFAPGAVKLMMEFIGHRPRRPSPPPPPELEPMQKALPWWRR